MPTSLPHRSHATTATPPTRRTRSLLALLGALLLAVTLPASGALAAPRSAGPVADTVTVSVTGLDLPAASGTPDVLLLAGAPFSLTVTLRAGTVPAAYSTRSDTDVRVATADGGTLTTVTVPAGASSATATGLRLPAANGVVLTAAALGRKPSADLHPGTAGPFDVVLSADTVRVPAGQRDGSLFVSRTGATEPCVTSAAPGEQTCVDAVLPNGVDSDVFFSTGLCTGDIGCRAEDGVVLQVLADLGTRYSATSPATLVVRCDKSRCGNGSIQSNGLQVNLDPTGDLTPSPACGAKGVMTGPDGHCIDYVQSRRDGSGTTYLYLLITRDARMSH
ncbi:hypothetical protein [Aquipuribacter sp. SD81]|uniref:hypothetical protein n=1 Tax=Aquipuribacter sp. SD81 TaxID=3127703 RepID=UPI003017AD4B